MITHRSSASVNSWLRCYVHRSAAPVRLFCFPYAGGGASIYRLWGQNLPPSIEVCALQLPGREDRLVDTPFTDLRRMVDVLVPALLPHLDRPFVFFGHSMGALISHAVTCRLQELGAPLPVLLCVSGRNAPHWPRLTPDIHHLPDLVFLNELQARHGGIPAAMWQEEELRRLFLPMLRADMTMVETYGCTPAAVVPCPIGAFGGTQDTHITQPGLAAWGELTQSRFSLQMFDGDHFYLKQGVHALLAAVQQLLNAAVPSSKTRRLAQA